MGAIEPLQLSKTMIKRSRKPGTQGAGSDVSPGVGAGGLGPGLKAAPGHAQSAQAPPRSAPAASDTLSARQQAFVPIAAFATAGDITKLGAALDQGLDASLTVSGAREVLVQVYAYAGFPRSLNALNEQRDIQEAPGRSPSRAIPKGDALIAACRQMCLERNVVPAS
jgi:4-carboxymuconolactone decarboxylase